MSSKRVEEEYKELVANDSWPQIYQRIGQKCHSYPYTFIEAKKPQNKPLNRYRDVNPYDHSRVILKRCDKDYINANLVKIERANRQYILTQGPLVFTVGHFWAMVWEQNTRAIIMLNKIVEKNELKCHWYWPHGGTEPHRMTLKEVDLVIEQTDEKDYHYYTIRIFKVTDLSTNETREITHFHYTTWPDFEVPSSPVAFLEFLERVRASGALEPSAGPAVVHCSAGIGRSGTFCLVDTVLLLIEKEGQANVDVQEILLEMRKYRMGLIQTSEQLRFSYQAIMEGIKRLDPEYKPELNESIYSAVAEEEAPPPPPRGASLGRPPARPLPAIPISTSLGNLRTRSRSSSSSSEGEPPALPDLTFPNVSNDVSSASSADDENDDVKELLTSGGGGGGGGEAESLRRRKLRELSERVAGMRKRAHDADRWHSLKRSLYTPLAISVGFLLAGILIYSYVKH